MSVLDTFRLDDKVVIVTGASSGLGVAFAQAFAEAGADVALGARRVEKMAATAGLVEQAGRRALTVQTDVADPAQCQALVDATVAAFGRVDILINNAGVGTAVPATRETHEQFRAVVDINPVSHLVTATRGLTDGTATATQIGWVLAASVILSAVFAPLAFRIYERS